MKKDFNPYYQPHERLTCRDVKNRYKKEHKMQLTSVFDLTNTNKYYDQKDWGDNINYFKYKHGGKNVPSEGWLTGITRSIYE